MSLKHPCVCGAKLKVPDSAVGRRVRCPKCGAVSRIKAPAERDTLPLAPGPSAGEGAQAEARGGIGDWLDDFASQEASSSGSGPAVLHVPEPRAAPPPDDDASPGRSGETGTAPAGQPPFWRELGGSFAVPLETGNLITLFVIAFAHFWCHLLTYAGCFGLIGLILLGGYLCAFYFSVVAETAAGEDDVPDIWVSSVFDDLIMPLVRFIGSCLIVLLPLLSYLVFVTLTTQGVSIGLTPDQMTIATILGIAGGFFWPAVVLIVALGQSLFSVRPDLVVRTVISAPLPYLTIWGVLLVTGTLYYLPGSDVVVQWRAQLWTSGNLAGVLLVPLLVSMITAYSGIVTMRVIGLYYRHYKHRFPWKAE